MALDRFSFNGVLWALQWSDPIYNIELLMMPRNMYTKFQDILIFTQGTAGTCVYTYIHTCCKSIKNVFYKDIYLNLDRWARSEIKTLLWTVIYEKFREDNLANNNLWQISFKIFGQINFSIHRFDFARYVCMTAICYSGPKSAVPTNK